MAEAESGNSRKSPSTSIGHAFIIAQSITAVLLVAASIAFILLWLSSLLISFMPNNGLTSWVASGTSAFGLFFIFLAAVPGIPGIIWLSRLVDHVARPWMRILKVTAWIGKVAFKVGGITAILILILLIIGSFGGTPQSEFEKTVAAFEVPLSTDADRDEFLSVLDAVCRANGMHLITESKEELKRDSENSSNPQVTMNASVRRVSDEEELIARAVDQTDHLGQVWLTFSRGESPEINTEFRERLMHEIMQRWPATLSLPVSPAGGIPPHADLVRTPTGYVYKPSAGASYGLKSAAAPQH